MFHAGMEAFVNGCTSQEISDAIVQRVNENYEDESYIANALITYWPQALNMVKNTADWMEREFFPDHDVLATELHLELALQPQVVYSGYIDLVAKYTPTGETVIVDYKSQQSFHDLHANDPQLLDYMWLHGETGFGYRGMHIITRRLKGTRKAIPPFVASREIRVTQTRLEVHAGRRNSSIFDLQTEVYDGHLLPTVGQHCSWRCPYIHVCSGMDDGQTDWLHILESQYYRKEKTDNGNDSDQEAD